jgi:hypothetical protein
MPRRAKSKRLEKAEERFTAAVTKFILDLGARPGRFYDHELDTPAGLLHISIHESWLATRFDDVARGTAFTRTCGYTCNPYSGKWNFHFSGGTPQSLHPDRVLPQLKYYFDCLIAWESQAA